MGTGLCLRDLSLPGSSDPRDGVPGEGGEPWVLRSCNLLTDIPASTILSPPTKDQTKKQLQQGSRCCSQCLSVPLFGAGACRLVGTFEDYFSSVF